MGATAPRRGSLPKLLWANLFIRLNLKKQKVLLKCHSSYKKQNWILEKVEINDVLPFKPPNDMQFQVKIFAMPQNSNDCTGQIPFLPTKLSSADKNFDV